VLKIAKNVYSVRDFSGMDSINGCQDKKHFSSYKKPISYRFNAMGYRDNEWPNSLNNLIWCIGDSFTLGLGQPVHETWPKMLESRTGLRCLNLGEDGCSNDSIQLKAQFISKNYLPSVLVIMWSYLHRRYIDGRNVHFDRENFGNEYDIKNFVSNYKAVENIGCNVVHSVIPNCCIDKDIRPTVDRLLPNNDIIWIKQLDRSRDGHHFDIKTSDGLSRLIEKRIYSLIPKIPK